MSLFVRKAGGAGGADVFIDDLGIFVPSGPTWLQLNASTPDEALGADGNFSARQIRDSQDLYDLIQASSLDWSKDGSTTEPNSDYRSDYILTIDFSDDTFDLTSGVLVSPNGSSNPSTVVQGQLFFNQAEQQFYVGGASGWEGIEMAAPRIVLIDEVKAQKYTYVGEAPPGTATTVSGWRIYRIDESTSGDEELIKLYANDSTGFDQVWDDRTTSTYTL